MKVLTGRYENGAVRLNEPPCWPDGTPAMVLVDVRRLAWREAGELIGHDDVGTWSGLFDSWESGGYLEPIDDYRCIQMPDMFDDLPAPTPEEVADIEEGFRKADLFRLECCRHEFEKIEKRLGRKMQ
jgi:hypothetical protein